MHCTSTFWASVDELVEAPYQWSEDHGFKSWLNLLYLGPWASPFTLPHHAKERTNGTVMAVMALSVDQFFAPLSSQAVCSLASWDGIRNEAVDRAASLDVDYNPAHLPSPCSTSWQSELIWLGEQPNTHSIYIYINPHTNTMTKPQSFMFVIIF